MRYSPDSVASSSAISSDGIGEALALRARLSQQALLQAAVPPAFPAEPVRGPARRPEIDRMHRAQRDHALRLTPSPPDTTEQQRSHNLASASPSAACSTVGDANCRSASDVTTAVSCVSVVVGLGANAAYSRVGTHKPRSSESFQLRCRSTMASVLVPKTMYRAARPGGDPRARPQARLQVLLPRIAICPNATELLSFAFPFRGRRGHYDRAFFKAPSVLL